MFADRLTGIGFLMVAAPNDPLASFDGMIPKAELAKHVQLVLTDRPELSTAREVGVMPPSTWLLGELLAKHPFLRLMVSAEAICLSTRSRQISTAAGWSCKLEDVPLGSLISGHLCIVAKNDPTM